MAPIGTIIFFVIEDLHICTNFNAPEIFAGYFSKNKLLDCLD